MGTARCGAKFINRRGGTLAMIYEYECKFCKNPHDVIKPSSRYLVGELCPLHKSEMKRLLASSGSITKVQFIEGFNPSFGKTFTTKSQQTEEIIRIRGETGREVYEVGNDKTVIKPDLPKVDMSAATKELRSLWRR